MVKGDVAKEENLLNHAGLNYEEKVSMKSSALEIVGTTRLDNEGKMQ